MYSVIYLCLFVVFVTGDSFKSMYDEPRRAVVEKMKNNRKQQSMKEPKPPPPPKKRHVKKQAPPSTKIIEESSSSSSSSSSSPSESESDIDVDTEEDKKIDDIIKSVEKKTSHTPKVHKKLQRPSSPVIQIPHKDDTIVEDINKDVEMDDKGNDTEETASATEDEILNNLIMYEHNYFERLPPVDASRIQNNAESAPWIKPGIKDQQQQNKNNNNNRTGHDGVALVTSPPPAKRRRESPEKGELKYKFRMRTKAEEERIIWNIYDKNNELDDEDVRYLKEAFESLQQVASKEVESYAWTDLTCILFNKRVFFLSSLLLLLRWNLSKANTIGTKFLSVS